MNGKFSHGGDWMSVVQKYGREPLDFSASVSPLGAPDGVRSAIAEAAAECGRYPDPLCRELSAAIADFHRVSPEHIMCGNGSADLLYRLVLAKRPRRAVVTAPTFSEYERALRLADCDIARYMLNISADFAVTEDICAIITDETDMLFLCEPNNPTGVITPKPVLKSILDRCRETGTLMVVDECFLDFTEGAEEQSLISELNDCSSLLILKAFTKLYGMAGVRLGYCLCSDEELLARMQASGQPWSVSAIAQRAGAAALRENEYVERVKKLVKCQRKWLKEQLESLKFEVVDGQANYLLFRAPAGLCEGLETRGILIRGCANYAGLDEHWYRTAVRTEEENKLLIRAIEEVLA